MVTRTLAELAAELGGHVVGDDSTVVRGVAGIREAQPGDITFLANARYAAYLHETRASAVLCNREPRSAPLPLLQVDNPYLAFQKVVRIFRPETFRQQPGVHPTAVVSPEATLGRDVSIGPNCVIERGARLGDRAVLMAGCYLGAQGSVGDDTLLYPRVIVREECVVGARCILHAGVVIGADGFGFAFDSGSYHKVPQVGNVVIGDDVEVGANTTIDRATTDSTRIGDGTKIDNLVQIGHNVVVGRHCIIVAQVGISGSTELEDYVVIGGQAGLAGHIRIGRGAQIGAQSGVARSVPAGETVTGYPAVPQGLFRRISAYMQKLPQLFQRTKALEEKLEKLVREKESVGVKGRPQRTIAGPIEIEGIGLHTGERGQMRFAPGAVGSGVRFVRVDLAGHPEIEVRPENAHFDPRAGRRTILQQDGVQVHTMEHVLAAVAGLGIDNLRIETSSMEIPEGHDGSAAPIARALMSAGVVDQDRPVRHVKIAKPVRWSENGVELSAVPYQGFRITFTIEYDHPLIGRQTASMEIDRDTFLEQIAPARTFVLERDLEALRQAGWIKGGRLESAVVVGRDKILNPEPLRFPDEFVRHKVLDLLGDLFLLGGPLLGHVTAMRSGHQGHVAFVKHMKETLPLPGRRAGASREEWDITAIMDIMPHRYPFLLVDRITRLEEGSFVEGIKNVTINEPFFQGHFPGHPIMPAVLIIEAMAQVGGMLLLNSVEDPTGKLMYFMGIDAAKFRRPVTPGDQLRFKVTLLKLKNRISKMHGEAFVDDQLVAEADLLATVVDKRPA